MIYKLSSLYITINLYLLKLKTFQIYICKVKKISIDTNVMYAKMSVRHFHIYKKNNGNSTKTIDVKCVTKNALIRIKVIVYIHEKYFII